MAKKDRKVEKINTAKIGQKFNEKSKEPSLDYLKAKILGDKESTDELSSLSSKLLQGKKKEEEDDIGLSDMASKILSGKSNADEDKEIDFKVKGFWEEPEVIEEEEVVEEEEIIIPEPEIIEEPEPEPEPEPEIVEVIPEPEPEPEIIEEVVIVEEEPEVIEEEVIIEELEPIVEPEVIIEEVVDMDMNDIDNILGGTVVTELRPYELIEDINRALTVRTYKKKNNKTTFTIHIPKVVPKYHYYHTVTCTPFNIFNNGILIMDFYEYEGKIDFTLDGMLFDGVMVVYSKLEFIKL